MTLKRKRSSGMLIWSFVDGTGTFRRTQIAKVPFPPVHETWA